MLSGRPIQVLRRTIVLRLLLAILFLPLAVGAGWGAVASLAGPRRDLVAAAVLGAIALAFAALLAFFILREGARRTCLYEDGIESVVGGRRISLPWSEVTEIWFEAIRVQAGGLVGAAVGAAVQAASRGKGGGLSEKTTNMTVKLIGRGGEKLLLTSNDKGVVQGFETALAKVNPGLLAEARRRVREGQPVRFGPVTISLQGIARGSKSPVPFGEIEKLIVDGGKLRLKKQGAWLDAFAIPIKSVPNVLVLTELHAELAAGGSSGGAERAGRNLVRSSYI